MTPPGALCTICSAPLAPSAGKGRARKTCGDGCRHEHDRQTATTLRRSRGTPRTRGTPPDLVRRAEILAAVAIYGSQARAAEALGLSRQRVSQVVAYARV